MLGFLLKRLATLVPTLIGITLVAFGLIRLVPGDPIEVMMGERRLDPEAHAALVKRMGLDQPLPVQYADYVGKLLHGDLGQSLVSREPVAAVPELEAPDGVPAPGFALLDQDGVQVGRAQTAPTGLPVVSVPVAEPRTLQAVLSVLRQMPAALAAQVGTVSAQTQDTITMTLRDGVTVQWGSADETALKAAVLAALRASPAAAGVHTIDVSAPRMPITK